MVVRLGTLIAVLAAVVVAPAGASGALVIHVAPHASNPTCSAELPCSLQEGLTRAVAGDTVIMAGDQGSYGTAGTPIATELGVRTGVVLEGATDQPMAEVISTAPVAIRLGTSGSGAQRLANVAVHDLASGEAVVGSGTIERVLAIGSGALGGGCRIDATPTTIVDSVCAGTVGLFDILSPGFPTPFEITLRNVTLYGKVAGLVAFSEGPKFKIAATNTILHGTEGPDIEAGEQTGGEVEIDLDHSNYASVEDPTGGSVTAPGSPTNQTTAPQFADAAAGNFTEPAGAPTIDAGINDPANGMFDLAGNLRTLASRAFCLESVPAVTDIGAYEFVPVVPICGPGGEKHESPGSPPATAILKAKIHNRTASFRFRGSGEVSRFECKLDRGKFRRCTSPKTYRRLAPGRHRFSVRAAGPAGPDATPAARSFRIARP